MAKGAPDELPEGFLAKIREGWNDECCAEHDGTVASFSKLSMRLEDLELYESFFECEKVNVAQIGRSVGFALGGVAVFGPLSFVSAPAIASALGASGVLVTAGTGTAISTLSGAALTSASLAAVGGGMGVATGTAFITAAGAALGAVQGGAISNAYFGDVKQFRIRKLQDGRGPAVLFVNGFLSEKTEDTSDWQQGVQSAYGRNPWYIVEWEAKTKHDLGSLFAKGGVKAGGASVTKMLARRAAKKAANPLSWAWIVGDLLKNPWHIAMVRASKTGILLADLLARTDHRAGFVLMGHSLGARVVYYALQALSTREGTRSIIRDVHLFGGAVGQDPEGWTKAARAVRGNVYNAWSERDSILGVLYRSAQALQSSPVGIGPIENDAENVVNLDVSDLVGGHMQFKPNMAAIIDRSHGRGGGIIRRLLGRLGGR